MTAHLPDDEELPLCRLRYLGSDTDWGLRALPGQYPSLPRHPADRRQPLGHTGTSPLLRPRPLPRRSHRLDAVRPACHIAHRSARRGEPSGACTAPVRTRRNSHAWASTRAADLQSRVTRKACRSGGSIRGGRFNIWRPQWRCGTLIACQVTMGWLQTCGDSNQSGLRLPTG